MYHANTPMSHTSLGKATRSALHQPDSVADSPLTTQRPRLKGVSGVEDTRQARQDCSGVMSPATFSLSATHQLLR